ncbi:PKD domain-containing protein [Chitinophaga pinensis]|uniref:PKD domain containing protein n=1 Tax=Chitinophaga pinensis (strain ATCC 43595 / DSM 2588 / LMG 13176 / NBRC 15968 / NCIMB 11800 / UQM 2034) TaxID=485918 RepID=A0A979GZZ6_CHIPD|nr:PKD domain-containing protein [Chitinophaga pinensis]ACU64341.1 PKD domain containing protein [Chitinophaga pinensis DSM 2588]
MYRFLILAICCTFVHVRADAYHIIGGEIYYTYVGTAGDGIFRYEIVLKLYRDADFTCGPIQGCIDHFEDPVPINIYNGSGQRITNALQLYIKQTKPLRDTLKNPCLAPRTQNLEVAYYRDTVELPASPGGYYVTYQRCCRGEKLVNIYDSEHEGSTFYTVIPGTDKRATNSSTRFNHDGAIVICNSLPFTFNYSATDPDGDSLTYMLCSALTGGATRSEAMSTTPPPYTNTVNYVSPYSGANPMGGAPQISIDNNGILRGTPNREGKFVISVCVNEYDRRTKILLGTHHKDLLLTVFNCKTNIKAGFPSVLMNCVENPDLAVTIPNYSNAGFTSAYYWEFGDGTDTVTFDKTVFSHQYPDTGIYKVKLVVNRGLSCTDSVTGFVHNYPGLKADFTMEGLCRGEPIRFNDVSSYRYGKITSRRWDIGVTDAPQFASAVSTQLNYVYQDGGAYTVTLKILTDRSCSAELAKEITVYEVNPSAGNDTILAKGQKLQLNASGGEFYAWSPPQGLSNVNIADPFASGDVDMTYLLKVSNSQGCVGYDSISVKYYAGPEIYIPTAFSPNGDGQNDRFRFIPVGITEYEYFRIFNRWGQEIYSSTDFRQGWDGTIKGAPAPVDTYIWILAGKDLTGKSILKKGTVTLVK